MLKIDSKQDCNTILGMVSKRRKTRKIGMHQNALRGDLSGVVYVGQTICSGAE